MAKHVGLSKKPALDIMQIKSLWENNLVLGPAASLFQHKCQARSRPEDASKPVSEAAVVIVSWQCLC